MNNDWKPTEQNIGQPVSDNYIQPIGTLHIGSKWYDVDTTKLTSIKDVEAVFSAIGMKVSETNENFDKVKHLLIIPEKPKTLDEITQEFDGKIDELIEDVKYKFEALKYRQEYQFSKKITQIVENIEYAKENGRPREKFTLVMNNDTLSANSYFSSNFVIKSGGEEVGYYTTGGEYFRYYMNKKPNFVVRFCMNKLLNFRWVDVK